MSEREQVPFSMAIEYMLSLNEATATYILTLKFNNIKMLIFICNLYVIFIYPKYLYARREQVIFSMAIEYVKLMLEWKRACYFQYGYRICGTNA